MTLSYQSNKVSTSPLNLLQFVILSTQSKISTSFIKFASGCDPFGSVQGLDPAFSFIFVRDPLGLGNGLDLALKITSVCDTLTLVEGLNLAFKINSICDPFGSVKGLDLPFKITSVCDCLSSVHGLDLSFKIILVCYSLGSVHGIDLTFKITSVVTLSAQSKVLTSLLKVLWFVTLRLSPRPQPRFQNCFSSWPSLLSPRSRPCF